MAQVYRQQERIEYSKTFSLVIKIDTVRLFITLATSNGWNINQLDDQMLSCMTLSQNKFTCVHRVSRMINIRHMCVDFTRLSMDFLTSHLANDSTHSHHTSRKPIFNKVVQTPPSMYFRK